MQPSFHAGGVHCEDMGDYLLIGFVDDDSDMRDYLTFQRAHEFDEQDLRLGMDNVHVERNDQGYSGYGGMRKVTLSPGHLKVEFDKCGTEFMGDCPAMEVTFDLKPEQLKELREGMRRCFAGFDCFHDAN